MKSEKDPGWVMESFMGHTFRVDVGIARHFDDEDCQFPRCNSTRTMDDSVNGKPVQRMQKNLRCSEHKQKANTCAPLEGHLKLPNRIEWEDEQDNVEGHAGTEQGHLGIVVVPVIEV